MDGKPTRRMIEAIKTIRVKELGLEKQTEELLQRLMNHIEVITRENEELREENQKLRDELARLKGEKGKPKVKGNKPGEEESESQPKGKGKGEKKKRDGGVPRRERIKVDREEVIRVDRRDVPVDVEARGYREVVVQNIEFRTDTVVYRLERVYSPSRGQLYEATMPAEVRGRSYGSELEAFVIMLYFELRVPEEKIVRLLQTQGIVISAGQVSNLLIKKHVEAFARERAEVVRAGLETTPYQHIDDTGARVDGVNHYATVLCNRYYSSVFTNRRKNQETVAGLLTGLEETEEERKQREGERRSEEEPESEPGAKREEPGKNLGAYIRILVADDAGQFHDQTEHRQLCWIHEERHYKKLRPYFEEHQEQVDEFRAEIWKYYQRLKAYQVAPSPEKKAELSQAFDELFSRRTGYDELDHRIELTRKKKNELLLALEFPEVPIENNEAERDVRELVIKKKISNGTRTADGTKAWDVFLSLLNTCRKNEINFYSYLIDRISKANKIPRLETVIRSRARASPS